MGMDGLGKGIGDLLVVGVICTIIVALALLGLVVWGAVEAVQHLRWV